MGWQPNRRIGEVGNPSCGASGEGVGDVGEWHAGGAAHRFWAVERRNTHSRRLHDNGSGQRGMEVRAVVRWWWPPNRGSGRSGVTVGSSSTSKQARTVAEHGCPWGGAHDGRSGGVWWRSVGSERWPARLAVISSCWQRSGAQGGFSGTLESSSSSQLLQQD
jgi:hypothetical protein